MRRFPEVIVVWSAVLAGLTLSQSTNGGAVHFSDAMNGRLAWVVEDSQLPWTGTFNYLSSLKDRTALLTVADSSTGIPLGECSTNSFGDRWESFSWTLSAGDLVCTVSQTNSSRVRFVPSHSDAPRSFSVRIQASRGPRCMSSIVVEGRPSAGCPPVLSPQGFSQMSLQCGCPYSEEEPAFVQPAAAAAAAVVHPCSTHVCSNGGRCSVNDAGFAECQCADGFAGRHCENDVCAQVPCGNGGRCSAKGTIATCHCPKHTRGLLCEEIVCPTPCANGGSCTLDRTGEAVCDCAEGFTGPNCNVVDVCLGDAACSIYGPRAVCHIDEEATIAPRQTLLRETPFECKCQMEGSIEWVDCISLHVPGAAATAAPSSSVVIPPLAPHPAAGAAIPAPAATAAPAAAAGNGIGDRFQPNPNPGFSFGAHVTTTTTAQPQAPVVPFVPFNPAFPGNHQFTFQTAAPAQPEESELQAAAAAATTEQSQTAEMLPFVPPLFPAPGAATTSGAATQQIHITVPPTRVEGGSEESPFAGFETTTPEGVEVPSAVRPLFPVGPQTVQPMQPNPAVVQQPEPSTQPPFVPFNPFEMPTAAPTAALPTFTTAAPASGGEFQPFQPMQPLQPLQPFQPHQPTTTTTSVGQQGAGFGGGEIIDAVEQTTTGWTSPEESEFPTTTMVSSTEERDPFESSGGSGFVASTMETTVDGEESTVERTTMTVGGEEEEEQITMVPFVMPPAEEEEEEEPAAQPMFPFPATEPSTTTPSTTTTTTTMPTTSTTAAPMDTPGPFVPVLVPVVPAVTPSVFSRPRVPGGGEERKEEGEGEAEEREGQKSGSPFDSSSSSSSSRGGNTDRQAGSNASTAASWIVAIVAIAVLGLLLLATALVVLRYVRQSRKLHGKYNPAREEHALSSAYAMPMATVTKEERLI